MKEKMMKNQTKREECGNWFCSHIVVIAVIAFALGLFLSSCHFVKAEDYSTDMWAMVEEDLTTYNSSNTLSQVQSIYLQSLRDRGQNVDLSIAKFVRFECSSSRGGSIDNVVYYFCQYESAMYSMPSAMDGNLTQYYLGAYNYSESAGVSLDNVDTDKRFYILQIRNSNSVCFMNHRTQGTVSKSPSTFINTGYESDLNTFYMRNIYNTYDTFYGDDIDAYGDITSDTIIARGDNYLVDDDRRIAFYMGQSINWVSDSRLQFATWSDSLGRSILHVDMTEFLNSTGFNISNTTLNDFTLSIEYSVSNSDDIENHSISYNNSSEFYKEYGENGKITKIYMNIPYKEFYGFSYEENSFTDYEDVIIQNAIVNLDLVPIGGSNSVNITSYVDCLYYLQHVYEDIVPDVVPDPVYEDTVIYDTTILNNMKTALHNKTSQYSFVSGDWVFIDENDLPTFENWASVFTNYVWFADVNSDTTYAGHWWQMANNIPSVADLSRPFDPSEWIELNKAFAFYDVIVLKVWRCGVHVVAPSPPVVSVDELAGYLVLYSDRYYQHYEVENQLGIIKILQNDSTNAVSFYDAIKTRVDDFETKTLSAITGEDNSIFAYMNNLDSDLNSGIQRIIDNMPVFNWTPFNDDDILNALYTIVANQDNPKDGYASYIAWVKSESSSDDGFKLWANDMFDVFHDIYNFFNYQDDIDPNTPGLQKYIVYVQQYIKYLTQNTNDIDSSQYVYYKGIFDNTYNLHNIDGRSG